MSTEKEIRRFFKENRPQVHGSDKFMSDFVSKLEQLPTPAALSGLENETSQAKILAVKEAVRSIQRRNRLISVFVTAISVIVFAGIVASLSMLPELRLPNLYDSFEKLIAPISEYAIFLSLLLSAGVIVVALKSFSSKNFYLS